jgi:MYXO-CTERM domain-containing protein
LLGLPGTSAAHFILQSPAAATEQSPLGDPQKAPPCGDNGSAVATGVVTSFQAGETITVTIEETIFHPGHYRIALALDDGIFPEEPPVTPGSTPCGSAPIDPAPAFPVLADGVFQHSEPFGEPQSIQITLPDDVSCTNCQLQIIQFMSEHGLNDPGGCYYHHCAEISLEADPVGATEGTTAPGEESGGDSTGGAPSSTSGVDDTGGGPPATSGPDTDVTGSGGGTGLGTVTDDGGATMDEEGGCACSLPEDRTPGRLGILLGLLGLVGLRVRRRQ